MQVLYMCWRCVACQLTHRLSSPTVTGSNSHTVKQSPPSNKQRQYPNTHTEQKGIMQQQLCEQGLVGSLPAVLPPDAIHTETKNNKCDNNNNARPALSQATDTASLLVLRA